MILFRTLGLYNRIPVRGSWRRGLDAQCDVCALFESNCVWCTCKLITFKRAAEEQNYFCLRIPVASPRRHETRLWGVPWLPLWEQRCESQQVGQTSAHLPETFPHLIPLGHMNEWITVLCLSKQILHSCRGLLGCISLLVELKLIEKL